MRLITWNACKGGFDLKVPLLDSLRPDIAVIQEIAAPAVQTDQVLWFGDNPKIGMAVVANGAYTLRKLDELPDMPKYVIPIAVDGPVPFVLFAVWTLGGQEMKYVRALSTAIDRYAASFEGKDVVVMGDFNSNAIWDKDHPATLNHSSMVARLAQKKLVSAYHLHRKEAHGKESTPTFFHLWNEAKPFHIDYCFLPRAWADRIASVDIAGFAEWKSHSDHRPLVVDWTEPEPGRRDSVTSTPEPAFLVY
jgi:hypothetical protein